MPLINGQYIKPSELDEQRELRERHGIGGFVGGLGSEIAIASGSQLLGASTGLLYAPIAFAGGVLGSIANQRINDDPFSIGRAIAAGLINLVPGGLGIKAGRQAGKAAKLLQAADRGLNSYNSKTVPNIILREAGKGAGFGASEVTIQKIIDEERLPTSDEFWQYTGLGAGFGGAIGGILGATVSRNMGKPMADVEDDFLKIAPKKWSEMKGNLVQKEQVLKEFGFEPATLSRKATATAANQEDDYDSIFNSFLHEQARTLTHDKYIKAWLYSDDPTSSAGKVWFSKIKQLVAPSAILGKEFRNELDAINGRINEMNDHGDKIRKKYDTLTQGLDESERKELDGKIREYVSAPHEGDAGITIHSPQPLLEGQRMAGKPPPSIAQVTDLSNKFARVIREDSDVVQLMSRNGLRPLLDTWRKARGEVQQELLPFLDGDAIIKFKKQLQFDSDKIESMEDLLAFQRLSNTVHDSIHLQNYLTKEYRLFADADFVVDDDAKQKLIDYLVSTPGHFAPKISKGTSDFDKTKLLEQAEEKAKDYINHRYLSKSKNPANNKLSTSTPPPQGLGKIDEVLLKKNDLPKELVDFLGGDIEHIGETIFATGVRLAKLSAKLKAEEFLIRDLRNQGLINIRKFAGSDEPLPNQLKFENPIQSTVMNGQIIIEGPAPIMAQIEELKNTNFMGNVIEAQTTMMSKALDAVYRPLVGLSKATKVVANPASYPTNLLGAMTAAVASGNFNLLGATTWRGMQASMDEFSKLSGPVYGKIGRAVAAVGDLGLDAKGKTALLKDIGTMKRLGLMNADVSIQDTMRALGKGSMGRRLQEGLEPLSKAYQSTDNALRYVVWKGNIKKLKRMFPYADGMTGGQAKYNSDMEKAAAFLTNDTYQNYNKISALIRKLSAAGVMPPFVAFSAELTRNLYNNAKYAGMMIRGKFGKGLGLSDEILRNANIGAMQTEGWLRGTILTALTVGSYFGINYLNKKEGIDKEQMDALKNTVIPDYDRDKELIIRMNPDGKSGHYINASYINPFAFFNSFVRAYKDGTNTIGSFGEVAKVFANEFVGEGNFVFQELGDALRNTDEYGNPISIKEGQVGRTTEIAKHFFTELLKPGAVRELDKWLDALNNVGDNETKDLIHRMLGIRKTSFNLEKDPKWKIRPSKERLTIAEGRYFHKQKQPDISPELKAKSYQEANSARFDSMGKLQTIYDSLKVLGMSEDDAIGIMKDNRVSSSDIIQLSQNNIQNLEFSKADSLSDQYEKLASDTFQKTRQNILENTAKDPVLRKRLLNKLKKEQRDDRRGLTMFDRQLLGLGVAERADTLMSVLGVKPTDFVLVREYRRKGIITDDVLKAMRLRAAQARY